MCPLSPFAGPAIPKGLGDFRGGAGGRVRGRPERGIHARTVVQDGAEPPALRLRVAGGGEVFSQNLGLLWLYEVSVH